MKSDILVSVHAGVDNGAAVNTLRLGIIGFGNIGRQHYQAARGLTGVQVQAIADCHLIPDADCPGEARVYARWEDLVRDAEVDAVSICVPHHLHAPVSLAALEAGKHVLVEKPLALNVAEGRVLTETAAARNLVLMVEMTHRFYPPLKEARQLVQAGKIGQIYAVSDRIVEPVSAQLMPWMQSRKEAGGGVALTNGVHMLDRIAMLAGQPLHFQSGAIGFGAGLGDVEDTATMLLSLPDGVPVQLLAAWPRGDSVGGNICDEELVLYGTRATLRVWAWRGWRLEPLAGGASVQERSCYSPGADISERVQIGVRGALEEFAAAIEEGRNPRPMASAALQAQMLVEEFYHFVAF